MASNVDPLPLLKAKLDELERVVSSRFQPRLLDRPPAGAERAPGREPPVQLAVKDAPGAFRTFIARFFGSRG